MAFNNGDQPFTTTTPLGTTAGPGPGYEDIAVCGFRAKFGGDGTADAPTREVGTFSR